MFLKQCYLGLCGLSLGFAVSGGVFTVLVAVGLVTRFIGKTHTASHIIWYEQTISAGTIVGGLATIYPICYGLEGWLATLALTLFGFFGGIFVGCLAIAIAEMLNGIPIMARRFRFRQGLGYAILGIALGKTVGSLLYFIGGFYE